MQTTRYHRTLGLGLATLLALAGCGKSADDEGAALLASDATVLRYVPADSPYVLAALRPLPDDLLDVMEPKLDRVLRSYQSLLRHTVASALREGAGDGPDAEELERIMTVVDELTTLLSIEGLRAAGIERDATFVFYGHGLLPVLRMTLSDPAAFEAAINRVETRAGEGLSRRSIEGQAVREIEAEQVRVLFAVVDGQFVATAAPVAFDDAQLGRLLGLTLPAENVADARTLLELAERYDYTEHFVGFVDIRRLTEVFVGEPAGLDAELLEVTGINAARPPLSDVCRAEFRRVAAIAPRIAMGYNDVTTEVLATHAIVEVRDDLAAGLATLPAAVPGLGIDAGGLLSFGMSLNLRAARDFYEARLDALEAEPYECEQLVPLMAGIAAGRQALQQPVPPMVYDFRGFTAVVTSLEGMDLATNQPPTRVDGRLLLAMDNAPALVSLGQMFSPELAGLALEPNGDAVPLELPQLAALGGSAQVAMTNDAIAVSVGADDAPALERMLEAEAGAPGTLLAFGMDAGRYYGFIGQAMALEADEPGEEMPPEVEAAVTEMMAALSELYGRMTTSVRLTPRGVEMDSRVTLKE